MADASPLDKIIEDGVLRSIIVYLPLKEAVRTCVLSRRWKDIWTNLSYLPLNPYNILSESRIVDETVAGNLREKFIKSVNSVLEQHKGIGVKIFQVSYILNNTHSHHLDSWVRFAVESKTERLFLYLDQLHFPPNFNNMGSGPYNFPTQILEKSVIKCLSLRSCAIKLHDGFNGVRHLKNLQLIRVDISQEDISQILSNCLALEVIEFYKCQQLEILSISNSLSQLKNLMVRYCDHLRKMKIDAVNLTKLSYSGCLIEFSFRESSQLSEAYIDFYTDNMGNALTIISNTFRCLEILWFAIRGNKPQVPVDLAKSSYRFNHLRELRWTISHSLANKRGRLYLSSLMSAAPLLQKFSLGYSGINTSPKEVKQLKRIANAPHTHLRTVQFEGFMADKWQIKFAVHILDFAVKLESMTLFKAYEYLGESCKEYYEKNMEYLSSSVGGNAKLVIL